MGFQPGGNQLVSTWGKSGIATRGKSIGFNQGNQWVFNPGEINGIATPRKSTGQKAPNKKPARIATRAGWSNGFFKKISG